MDGRSDLRRSESRRGLLTLAPLDLSPYAGRGGGKTMSLSRRGCVRVLRRNETNESFASRKGRPSAERRTIHWPRSRKQVYAVCATHLLARQRLVREPLAFRRFAAALARASERSSSVQAALHAIKRMQALPAPSIALKPNTWRPGRNARGVDARTARERGHKPRPQEPHSLHPTAVTGRRP
jgi:hypothetical protein